jgi:hypothetical protein
VWIDDGCLSLERYICESGEDQCPADPQKVEFGICGCGVPDVDSDGDGKLDCEEQCPNDPSRLAPGDCGCANAPKPAGTECHDGLCAANTTCNGAGRCGNPASCTPPDAQCRSAFTRSSHYWLCDNHRTFHDAELRCESAGMSLATVEDAFENSFLAANTLEHVFLGATDLVTEGDWIWSGALQPFWTGGLLGAPAAARYSNWKLFEPSDVPFPKDCLVKDSTLIGGFWRAESCEDLFAYACERPFNGSTLPRLGLVAQVELVPARSAIVEAPIYPDGVTANPNGIQKVIASFSEPVDPASFSLTDHGSSRTPGFPRASAS